MAIYKPGALIGAISGNVGGLNFANTPYAPVIRKKLARTKQFTSAQLARRTRFRTIQQAWQDLTDQQRTSWRTAATQLSRPNRLGLPTSPNGFQFFVKYNMRMDHTIIPIVTLPPEMIPTLPPTNWYLDFRETGPYFGFLTPLLPNRWKLARYFGSRPVSSKSRQHWGNWKHLLTTFAMAPTGANFISWWDPILGPLREGEQVAITAQLINVKIGGAPEPFGLPSITVIASTTVTAPP